MPRLSYADNISYTPDFFNDSKPEMEFLDGYDYDSLRKIEDIAFISKDYAKEHGIENGDTIRITAWQEFDELAICSMMDLKVVGIYDVSWKTDVIYIPWIKSYEHIYYIDFDYPRGEGIGGQQPIPNAVTARYVRAVTLTLKNTEELSAFRNYLEDKGYSQVGKVGVNRKAIVIQDKRLMDTVQNLKSFIRLIEIIQPIMMILFGVIGFAVSYLLMKHRTNEFAIMRSIGAKKRQVFLSFYLEQLLLFMAGLLPAVIYAIILPQKIAYYGASLVYFIVCYLFGTALALIIMNRAKILDVLFTKE
jgi:ABC-type lipoprotein release transport system permease subunit